MADTAIYTLYLSRTGEKLVREAGDYQAARAAGQALANERQQTILIEGTIGQLRYCYFDCLPELVEGLAVCDLCGNAANHSHTLEEYGLDYRDEDGDYDDIV